VVHRCQCFRCIRYISLYLPVCVGSDASDVAERTPPCAMRRTRCIGVDASGAYTKLLSTFLCDASVPMRPVCERFTAYCSASLQNATVPMLQALSEAYYPPPSCVMRRFRCVRWGKLPYIVLLPCKTQRSRCFTPLSEALLPSTFL
jgi:hypothetical protein